MAGTARKTTAARPAQWGADAEVLDGVDLIDKAELVGTPFIIRGVWFEINARGVEYVYAEAERKDGTFVTFNDSSSGVRAQLQEYLKQKTGSVPDADGTVIPMAVLIPNGLRVSEYDVRDEQGKQKRAKTYYLTVSGKRRTA